MAKYTDYGTLSSRYVEEIAYSRSLEEARRAYGFPATLPESATLSATMAELSANYAPQPGINVKAAPYFAVLDGITDDTAALQAAAAALPAGGSLLIPGFAKTSATINITAPDVTVSSLGTFGGIVPANATFNLITLGPLAHRAKILNMWIKGAATDDSTTQFGVWTNAFAAPDDVEIMGCYFGAPISTGGSLNSGVKADGGNRWKVVGNTFSYLWGSISGTGYGVLCGTHNKGTFSRNHYFGVAGRGRHGVYLSAGCTYCKVFDNYVEGAVGSGFPIYATSGQTANTDNEIYDNTILNGGALVGGSAAIEITGKCSRNIVRNNKIYGYAAWGIVVVNGGNATTLDENVIADNEIRNTSWAGISVQGASNTKVRNNRIFDVSQASVNTYPGIDIRIDVGFATVSTGTIVEGNLCKGSSARSGLWMADAGHTGTVMNNNTFDCWSAGRAQFDNGGACVVRGQNNDFGHASISGDNGDAAVTLQASRDQEVARWVSNLTANRIVTLSSTNVFDGAKFRVLRTGLGAFTLDVGGLKTIPGSTAAFVDVQYDSTVGGWKLTGYGTL